MAEDEGGPICLRTYTPSHIQATKGVEVTFAIENLLPWARLDVEIWELLWGDGTIDASDHSEVLLFGQRRIITHRYVDRGTFILQFEWNGGFERISDGMFVRPDGELGTCSHEHIAIPVDVDVEFTPALIEPERMPVEGGLRIRVIADAGGLLEIGGIQAVDHVSQGNWLYATAPALPSGVHAVHLLTQAGISRIGLIRYAEELVPSSRGAVDAFVVGLRELAYRSGQPHDEESQQALMAERDLRGNAVDNVIQLRATTLESDFDTFAVEAIWAASAETIRALDAAIAEAPVIS